MQLSFVASHSSTLCSLLNISPIAIKVIHLLKRVALPVKTKTLMKKLFFLLLTFNCFFNTYSSAQTLPIEFVRKNDHDIQVLANKKPFVDFFYADTFPKPVLYPIYAADGEIITRGFPLAPRPNEPTDHPHHVGLWLNYENVNGLDFWNNSYAIAADKKNLYGSIKTDSAFYTTNGEHGILTYDAHWQ